MGVDFNLIRKKLDIKPIIGICPECGNFVDVKTGERLEDIKFVRGRLSHKTCNICYGVKMQAINQELAGIKK